MHENESFDVKFVARDSSSCGQINLPPDTGIQIKDSSSNNSSFLGEFNDVPASDHKYKPFMSVTQVTLFQTTTATVQEISTKPPPHTILPLSIPKFKPLPYDHSVIVNAAKRESIFYRPPKLLPGYIDTFEKSEEGSCNYNDGWSIYNGCTWYDYHSEYITNDEEYCDCNDTQRDRKQCILKAIADKYDGGIEDSDTEDDSDYFTPVEYCKQLPYWTCIYAKDLDEFIFTHVPHNIRRPDVAPEQFMDFSVNSKYYPWTPELVNSIVEDIYCIYKITQCHADITFDRRLPTLETFIWNLVDGLETDLWTGLTTLILIRRYERIHSNRISGVYDSAHKLFLGVFMIASTMCVKTNAPEKYHHANIISILGLPYTSKDMVEIKHSAACWLEYKVWVSETDIVEFTKMNLYDIRYIHQSYSHYLERQRYRQLYKEQEMQKQAEIERLKKSLEKYMFNIPCNRPWII